MLKNYKPRAIETLAQNTLKHYNEELVCGDPCEIPIEELIEFHFGIIVQYRNLSKNGVIHGVTVFEDSIIPVYDTRLKRYEAVYAKAGTILIDSRLLTENKMKRLRFTLAHELGHWMIHQDYYKEIDELASKTSSDSDIRTEREADSLGAALLMPYGRVKVAFCRLKPKLTKEAAVTHMAQLFNVSVQAMEIRLKTIGLI
jgi:Zn-dependent peptidase ImmA (M78 family)